MKHENSFEPDIWYFSERNSYGSFRPAIKLHQRPWARSINRSAFERLIECLMKHFSLLILVIIRINLNNVWNTAKKGALAFDFIAIAASATILFVFFSPNFVCVERFIIFQTLLTRINNEDWYISTSTSSIWFLAKLFFSYLFENQSKHRFKVVKITRIWYLFLAFNQLYCWKKRLILAE